MGRWATAIQPGKPLPMEGGPPTPAEIVRFLKKFRVEQLLPLDSEVQGPCWIWTAGKDPRGYGFFKWRGRKVWVNRFSHEAFKGPVADGDDVDHLCFSRACGNPAHLATKTPSINRGRKQAAAAARAARATVPEPPAAEEADWQTREDDEGLAGVAIGAGVGADAGEIPF